jgi:uncharacterized membrane protein (Fun14 family)
MSVDAYSSFSATIGGGFFGGLLLGYALKKIVKIVAVIIGVFIAGLAYLQYQQIDFFDWNRIESVVATTLGNMSTQISNGQDTAALVLSNFGIPLTGSMSAGFTIGIMKG